MAKQVIINVKANTSNAISELDQTKQEIQKLNKEVTAVGKKSPQEFKKLEQGVKKTGEGAKKTATGFSKLGIALKGLGIGLLISAFGLLTQLFQSNQKVVDIFKVSFEALSIVFNDFVRFIEGSVSNVKDFFHTLFTEPQVLVKKFIQGVIDRTIERIQSAVDMVGLLGSAFKKLFSGDFAGALKDANDAGDEFVDIITGVDDTVGKVGDAISNAVKSTKEYATETFNAAKSNVELAKAAELATIANQGLIEKYDRQAEQLRQVRDDERLSIAERKKANDELALILDEQEKVMLRNAQVSLDAANAELKKDENNIEAKKRVMEAQNELAAVEAQIEGFRSEQKMNDLALDRELIEMTNAKLEAEANLLVEGKRFNAEQIQDNLLRLEEQKRIDGEEQTLQTARLQRIVDEAAEGTQAKIDAQIALDEFTEQSRQQNITRDKEILEEEKLILDARKQAQLGFASAVGGVMNALGGLLQEGTAASKAAALADIVISTGVGFAQGLDIAQKTAKGTGPAAAFAFPIFYATQIAAVLSSVSKAKQILSQVKGGAGSGGSVSTPSAPVAQSQAPSFNIVGSDPQNQLAQTLAQQTNKPVKAFVVSGDVTTAQSLERNIIEESSLG